MRAAWGGLPQLGAVAAYVALEDPVLPIAGCNAPYPSRCLLAPGIRESGVIRISDTALPIGAWHQSLAPASAAVSGRIAGWIER